ncbi:hypothetical protein ACH4VS_21850 [Streptomyces hygroscopicus]|uniref:hypothetical protein n=1 Tax=Streptomyces hygroscopicus TaxID=1912 RepID=UPI000830CAA8|nr:hypothetical protein [Streptomyces hygroscopicus]GLV76078.1 hypothetical protein Shyhy02_40780 [Streptomyces hygroscopicus subsp. hygroscopicus]
MSGPEAWGWQGRTLGHRAADRWLRVVTAVDKAGGRLWEGTALADTEALRSVPRPRPRGPLDWKTDGHAYRAELPEYVGGEPTWYASRPTVRRGFCPHCANQLASVADDSETITVTGFSLDDGNGTDPVGHSFHEETAPWMIIDLAPDPHAAQPTATSLSSTRRCPARGWSTTRHRLRAG